MPLRLFECTECGMQFKTKKPKPLHCEVEAMPLMTVPGTKFMEKQDQDKNRSAMVGQENILRERARKHSRDVEMDDLIQKNERELAHQNGWINEKGTRRTAIDDK